MGISLDVILRRSDNIVFRKIQDEYILVPIVASAADVESIFNLNETGAAVWERIDGMKKLSDIIEEIKSEYETEGMKIEDDVTAFVIGMIDAKLIEAL